MTSNPRLTPRAHYALRLSLIALTYFLSAEFGLSMGFKSWHVSAIWPPSGIALAALWICGWRYWPAVFVGSFAANALAGEPWLTAGSIAAGITTAAVLGVWMLKRWFDFNGALERVRDVNAWVIVAAATGLVSATWGVLNLRWAGRMPHAGVNWAWLTWWTGDALGIVVIGSLCLAWWPHRGRSWRVFRRWEFVLYALGIVLFASYAILSLGSTSTFGARFPLAYPAFIVLIWAALRFDQRAVTACITVASAMAVLRAIHGLGAVPDAPLDQRLVALDTLLATLAGSGLVIGAVTAERRRAEAKFRRLLEFAPDAMVILDDDNRIVLANRRVEQYFGFERAQLIGQPVDALIPGGANALRAAAPVADELTAAADERLLQSADRGQRRDGSAFPIEMRLSPLHTEDGLLTTASIRDITERHEAHERLREAREQLELRVRERTAELGAAIEQLRSSLLEKEILLKEVHHRVKNNLQIICSLLNLQTTGHAEETVHQVFRATTDRVRSMAMVHEHLYGSHDLQCLRVGSYFRSLISELARGHGAEARIRCAVDAQDIDLPMDLAIPCGLIVNEMVTNALKHAFPNGQSGSIRVALAERGAEELELIVSDDGIGLADGIDQRSTQSFGLRLVGMLASQLKARLEVVRSPGTTFRLLVPRGA